MPALDSTDYQILAELEKNGRLTNKALAECIGLSASACFERVRRLERSGIIGGYRAIINTRLLGAVFNAWVEAALESDAASAIAHFHAHIQREPIVSAAYQLAQPHEFLLHVLAPSGFGWGEFLRQTREAGISLTVVRMALVTDFVKKPTFSLFQIGAPPSA